MNRSTKTPLHLLPPTSCPANFGGLYGKPSEASGVDMLLAKLGIGPRR